MQISSRQALLVIIIAQTVCTLVLLSDVFLEKPEIHLNFHFFAEAAAAIMLFVSIGLEAIYLRRMIRRKNRLELNLQRASTEIHKIIDSHFDLWDLTSSERDVATLLIKGLSLAEIAAARGSAEGTVKAQTNAIYRKSGSRNRADVLVRIMDAVVHYRAPEAEAGLRAAE